MSIESDIKDALFGRNKGVGESIFTAEVVTVGESTCTVKEGNFEYEDVSLCAVGGGGDALTIKPKVGSMVAVADLSGTDRRILIVCQYTDVANISLFGGKKGGLCNVPTLRDELNKAKDRIDAIIDALCNSATAAQDGGATYKAQIAARLSILLSEDYSDIEDERFKH